MGSARAGMTPSPRDQVRSMDLKVLNRTARELFDRINRERFLPRLGRSLPPVPLRFSRRMTRSAGQWVGRGSECEIVLSVPFLVAAGWGEMEEVLAHEMVHVWEQGEGRSCGRGHSARFREVLAVICGTRDIRHHVDLSGFGPPRRVYACPRGHRVYRRRRFPRGRSYSCGECDPRGYNRAYRLRFVGMEGQAGVCPAGGRCRACPGEGNHDDASGHLQGEVDAMGRLWLEGL